ncbi:transposase family protein [Streptomyces erythrochromogenes]|uniref:transposase family protein n=1 Tax=Streptomyces erythrochromogenes TaxID=285574 RepID=UPI0033343023
MKLQVLGRKRPAPHHRDPLGARGRRAAGPRAPRLDRALKKIARSGGGVVLLDGSLIRTRRCTGSENRKNYSSKSKCHGLLVIALTDDKRRLLRVSAARPGRTSEITACRHDHLTDRLREAGLGAIADLGFVGLDATDRTPTADRTVQQGAGRRPRTGRARLRAPEELARAQQGTHRPEMGDRPGQGLLALTNREVAR